MGACSAFREQSVASFSAAQRALVAFWEGAWGSQLWLSVADDIVWVKPGNNPGMHATAVRFEMDDLEVLQFLSCSTCFRIIAREGTITWTRGTHWAGCTTVMSDLRDTSRLIISYKV